MFERFYIKPDMTVYASDENTGMCYELWTAPDDWPIVGVYHDEVGLVTWFQTGSIETAEHTLGVTFDYLESE